MSSPVYHSKQDNAKRGLNYRHYNILQLTASSLQYTPYRMRNGIEEQQDTLFDLEPKEPKSNLLRWAGSKANYPDSIGQFIDFKRPYLEPFCGSAAVFFRFNPAVAYLNDTNERLISFYRHLALEPKKVWCWYFDQPVHDERYYEIRAAFNEGAEPIVQAAMFLYLNHFGFNGVFRTNQKGMLNTPFGARIKPKRKLTLGEVQWFADRLPTKRLTSLDFEEAVSNADPTDSCIFFDPPYYTTDSRVFSEYGAKPFDVSDLGRLFSLSSKLATTNRVVVSYKDCSEFRNLFSEYITFENDVVRSVSGDANARRIETELIAVMGK